MERRGQLWCVGGLHGSVAGNDIGFTSPMSFMEMYGAWAGPPWMRLVDYVSTTIMERRGLIWNVLPICKGRGGMEDVGEGDRGTQIFQRLLWFLLHSGFKDYTLLGQASTFYKLVIIWLMDFVGGFKMPLPSTCPMKFACIPEHFVDDAMDLLGITFGIPEVSKVVALIVKIYVHIVRGDKLNVFPTAISKNGRSYNEKIDKVGKVIKEFVELGLKADDAILGEIPDEFLDPILYTLMRDPVILPLSRQSVDRPVMQSHLLNGNV
ncbi:hypothetical protein ZIOFF_031179 [Zingiber officinale]|uniref:U-box domain-containing protein n=1 Tax=Zingiber officinale TaxID=94328 RepID=A0A8J5GRZ2_ZINOF|nr:hypothetical protein ZIOFF_031179 [Zingiber officinale]